MRTRFPQPQSKKGSQRWIQSLVNDHSAVLDTAIGLGPITWRSPLRADDFAEYRDNPAFEQLGATLARRPLNTFWPAGGPQWDGLGRARSGEFVLLEAQAHIPEMFSNPCGAAGTSLKRILKSLDEAKAALRARPGLDWSLRFYQYANRLAHAYLMNQLNRLPAKLVFLHLIGDPDMDGPETRASWEAAVEVVHEALGIRGRVPSYVQDAFVGRATIPAGCCLTSACSWRAGGGLSLPASPASARPLWRRSFVCGGVALPAADARSVRQTHDRSLAICSVPHFVRQFGLTSRPCHQQSAPVVLG
jgi:hypothetical protein